MPFLHLSDDLLFLKTYQDSHLQLENLVCQRQGLPQNHFSLIHQIIEQVLQLLPSAIFQMSPPSPFILFKSLQAT